MTNKQKIQEFLDSLTHKDPYEAIAIFKDIIREYWLSDNKSLDNLVNRQVILDRLAKDFKVPSPKLVEKDELNWDKSNPVIFEYSTEDEENQLTGIEAIDNIIKNTKKKKK